MQITRQAPFLRHALRHPTLVALVMLVCLSGWCMAVSAAAPMSMHAGAEHAGGHHGSNGDRLAAPVHSSHSGHCADGTCCQVAAKGSPTVRDIPLSVAGSVAHAADLPAAVAAVTPTLARPPGAPPGSVSLPLIC
jgi:hypothetical protein